MRVPWQIAKPFSIYIRNIKGAENIPKDRCIIASSHSSSLDTLLLLYLFKRKLIFVAERRLLQHWIQKFVVYFLGKSIPNKTGGNITLCASKLHHDKTVALFIQGDIHPKYKGEGRIHTGAVVLSSLTRIPIIPVKIENSDKIWPITYWPLRPCKIKSVDISVGRPVTIPNTVNEDDYQKLSDQLFKQINKL